MSAPTSEIGSLNDLLRSWPADSLKGLTRKELLSKLQAKLGDLTAQEAERLLYDWRFWARPAQLPPEGEWTIWFFCGARGSGKTRAGAEWALEQAKNMPGSHGALLAATPSQARDTMVELGESSILRIAPPWFRPVYEPSKRRLSWPNGSTASIYSAFEYEELRGPQFAWAWIDELAKFTHAQEAWDQLMFGLRLGKNPRVVVTSTPRPIRLIRELLNDPTCAVTRSTTYENRANLAKPFLTTILRKYEGTSLGRQELLGELLENLPGALWKRSLIDKARVPGDGRYPLVRIAIGIDPAASTSEESAETGIVACGKGEDGDYYVIDDRSGRFHPDAWGRRALNLYTQHEADVVVAEVNHGGDMVGQIVKTVAKDLNLAHVPYKAVRATRGKAVRAEPVSSLYEQGRVHHIGIHAELEDQLVTWDPENFDESPDRLDALVWAMSELMNRSESSSIMDELEHPAGLRRRF